MVVVIDQKKLKKGELKKALANALQTLSKKRKKKKRSLLDFVGKADFGKGDPLIIQKEMRRDKR
jgi:hypothetical protein